MSEQQSLIEVKRALPAELMNRFDTFLVAVGDKVAESEQALQTAQGFVVDSEAAFIVADSALANLKQTNKALNDERLEITRPIDDFKNQFLNAVNPIHKNYESAQALYTAQMSAYRRKLKAEAEEAQRKAEALLREEREKKEAEARRLEEKANKLKTEKAREAARQEAAEIRQVAAMMPESVALSASAPASVSSNVAEIWDVEKIVNMSDYLRWLADHPEWHGVLKFADAEHKRLAKQFHSIGVPGLKFCQRDSFRSKSGRR